MKIECCSRSSGDKFAIIYFVINVIITSSITTPKAKSVGYVLIMQLALTIM
jgi:hypothetical protein